MHAQTFHIFTWHFILLTPSFVPKRFLSHRVYLFWLQSFKLVTFLKYVGVIGCLVWGTRKFIGNLICESGVLADFLFWVGQFLHGKMLHVLIWRLYVLRAETIQLDILAFGILMVTELAALNMAPHIHLPGARYPKSRLRRG